MSKKMEGIISNQNVMRGMIFKGLKARWAAMLFMAFIFAAGFITVVASGGGGWRESLTDTGGWAEMSPAWATGFPRRCFSAECGAGPGPRISHLVKGFPHGNAQDLL